MKNLFIAFVVVTLSMGISLSAIAQKTEKELKKEVKEKAIKEAQRSKEAKS
ncbi:MAG: hypothetical protein KKD31_13005 [Bacteroidetes bacterium]|nr:hypothetical protein [Bacteroidota bacterium]